MNKTTGYVGILVASRKQRKYMLKQYLDNNASNMKLYCFTPTSINWGQKRIVGLHRLNGQWVESLFPFPQVVYNRCYNRDSKLIERLEAVIGRNKCFNHINRFNKHIVSKKLSRWLAPHLPETVLYDKELAVHFLWTHRHMYFKPCFGNKGKGVYRVELKDSGEIEIGYHHYTPHIIVGDMAQFQERIQQLLGSTPYVMQKGIHVKPLGEQTFDIRVLVQKNKSGQWAVTNVVSRIAHKGYFNTSICENVCLSQDILTQLYSPEEMNAILCSIYDTSLRAAEILEIDGRHHLAELSVDFVLDNEGHGWIIEVNGKPSKDLYDGIHKRYRVYKRPMEYAKYLSKYRSN